MLLLNFQNLGNTYKKVTSPMWGYQGKLKGARFAKITWYSFVLEIRPRQFANVGISCLNNGLLRHLLNLLNSCLLDNLRTTLSLDTI